jgi:hypothetical protein
VAYDEIFVNGKEIGSSMSEAFREIKDKIIEIVSFLTTIEMRSN